MRNEADFGLRNARQRAFKKKDFFTAFLSRKITGLLPYLLNNMRKCERVIQSIFLRVTGKESESETAFLTPGEERGQVREEAFN